MIHHAAASAAQIVDETMRGTEAESSTLDDAIPEDDAEVSIETDEAIASESVSVLEPGDAPEEPRTWRSRRAQNEFALGRDPQRP